MAIDRFSVSSSNRPSSRLARAGRVSPASLVLVIALGLLLAGMLALLVLTLGGPGATGGQGAAGASGASGASDASGATSASGAASIDNIPEAIKASNEYLNRNEPMAAATIMQRAIEKFPEDQRLRVQLAKVWVLARKPELALEQYTEAIRIGPPAAALHSDLATVANAAGRLDLAAEHYAIAAARDPAAPLYPLYLAMIQIKQGERTKAQANLLRALKLDPNMGEAIGTLGELQFQENNLELAAQQIARARELQPQVMKWRVVQARILTRQNRPEDALALFAGLSAHERTSSDVLAAMAMAHGMLKAPARAAALYAEVRAAMPASSAVGEWLYEESQWRRRAGENQKADELLRLSAESGYARAQRALETPPPPAAPTNP